jgi:tetratricopeptide (TPR) repeat protein
VQLGWAELEARNYSLALSNFNAAIRLDPKNANAYCGRGVSKWQLQDFQGAIADYDKAIALNPACGGYYCNRGQAEFSLNRIKQSLADYNAAIELDPASSQAYYNRGLLKATCLKNYTGAVRDFTKAIDFHSDPHAADIFYWRGNARLQLGDYRGAVDDYTEAVKLGPAAWCASDLQTNLTTALKALHESERAHTQGLRAVAQDAVSVTGAEVTEVGIYKASVIKTFAVPGVAGGTNEGLDSFTLVEATTNVPARIGTRFGFRYTIHGTPSNAPIDLTMVGEHPPYRNPKTGKTQARDVYGLQSWIGQTYASYLFGEEWELIPGKFRFEVWHKGKKLCEQSFVVVRDTGPKDKR